MSSVVVTATADPTNVPPRVRLDISDAVNPLVTSTTVVRNNPDGSQSPIRTADGNPLTLTVSGASTVGLLYDYEMPYGGQGVTYTTVESPGNVTASVTVDPGVPWLVHPGVPALSVPVQLRAASLQEESLAVKQGVFYVMGRATPVVISDGARKSSSSTLVVQTTTQTELDNVRALLSDAGVLLLNVPPSLGLGYDTSYIAPGDVKVTRLSTVGTDPNRDVSFPFVVVDMPAGGNSAQRSYTDLLANFSTYAQTQASYASYVALLSGP